MTSSLYWRKMYYRSVVDSKLPLSQKIKLTENLFDGKDVYIFAAGPSLKNIDMELLRPKLKRSLVFCIKQSYEVVKEFCDVIIMNYCNFQDYEWDEMNSAVFWASFEKGHAESIESNGYKCSHIFDIKNNKDGFRNTTAFKNSWGSILNVEDSSANWGPGLMYEIAIPIALSAKPKNIHLVGWDIGSKTEEADNTKFMNDHFYDHSKVKLKTKITNEEIDLVSSSTYSLWEFLKEKGIELTVISDRSLVNSKVVREMEYLK